MFHQPGKKLKSVAKVLFWIGVVFSVILVLVLVGATAVTDAGNTLAGLVGGLIYAAILIAAIWVSCLSMYAMGHMVETLDAIKKNSDQVWAQKDQTQDAE